MRLAQSSFHGQSGLEIKGLVIGCSVQLDGLRDDVAAQLVGDHDHSTVHSEEWMRTTPTPALANKINH